MGDAPEKLWLSAASDENEREIWTDPDDGGTEYIRLDIVHAAIHAGIAAGVEEFMRDKEPKT